MISPKYKFSEFTFDPKEEILRRDDEVLTLNPKTSKVLAILLENAGNIVTKEEFFEKIWADSFVEDNNLTVAIAAVRKVLGETKEIKFIQTIPKKGYRFIAEVETIYANLTEQEKVSTKENIPSIAPKKSFLAVAASRKYLFLIGFLVVAFTIGAFWRQSLFPAKSEPFQSIAVMPFAIDKNTPNNAIFAEKLTQELIFNLRRITDTRVSSFNATAVYNSPETNQSEAGQDLKVDGIISGKIVGAEESELVISIRDLRSGETVFTKNYPLNPQNLADSQYRVARDLAAEIGKTAKESASAKATENLEAYQNYLEGRHFLSKNSSKEYEKAIENFTAAVVKDANFADAHSALAMAHIRHGLALYGARGLSASRRSFPLAKESAIKTLEIKKDSDEALAALGFINYRHEYDWSAAESNFRKALALNPNNLQARRWFGEFLHKTGRFDEGFAEQEKALALDPNSAQILSEIAWGNYLARRFDEAENYTKKSLYIDKSNAATLYNLSEINEQKGNLKEAVELWKEAMMLESAARRFIAEIEQKSQTGGREGFTRAKAEWLEDLIEKDYVYPTDLAKCYAVLGDKDKAIMWLEKGIEARVPDILSIKYAPAFDNLREDDRFQDLLKRMNFPQ